MSILLVPTLSRLPATYIAKQKYIYMLQNNHGSSLILIYSLQLLLYYTFTIKQVYDTLNWLHSKIIISLRLFLQKVFAVSLG